MRGEGGHRRRCGRFGQRRRRQSQLAESVAGRGRGAERPQDGERRGVVGPAVAQIHDHDQVGEAT